MKMKTVVDALPSIRKIANHDLPMQTLYRVKRLLDKLDAHLRFYDETRAEIIGKYCETGEDGRQRAKDGAEDSLEREMSELLSVSIDTEDVKPVKIPTNDGLRLSYADLCALDTLDGLVVIDFGEEADDNREKEDKK